MAPLCTLCWHRIVSTKVMKTINYALYCLQARWNERTEAIKLHFHVHRTVHNLRKIKCTIFSYLRQTNGFVDFQLHIFFSQFFDFFYWIKGNQTAMHYSTKKENNPIYAVDQKNNIWFDDWWEKTWIGFVCWQKKYVHILCLLALFIYIFMYIPYESPRNTTVT